MAAAPRRALQVRAEDIRGLYGPTVHPSGPARSHLRVAGPENGAVDIVNESSTLTLRPVRRNCLPKVVIFS
jgi:hypothetical protein